MVIPESEAQMQSTLYALALEAHRAELRRQAERARTAPVRRRHWFSRTR